MYITMPFIVFFQCNEYLIMCNRADVIIRVFIGEFPIKCFSNA
jgi:hypothetical protein